MLTISQATQDDHEKVVRELFSEYLHWACPVLLREYGVEFDPDAFLAHDMANLDIFSPPHGRLLLARADGNAAGCACVRTIAARMAEIKRMYVRPTFRRQGIGRALVDAVIKEARTAGYSTLRLDSARFMTDAHALYRSVGFQQVAPYPESEIPQEFHPHWFFMEMSLE